MIKKPQILTLNLKNEVNKKLSEKYSVYEGSLGKIIDTKNEKYEHKYCLVNRDFPSNLHEYDIVIIDFSNKNITEYNREDNVRSKNKSANNIYLLCEYPQTILDTRALASHILFDEIKSLMKKDAAIIIFQSENEEIEYQYAEENGQHPRKKGVQTCTLYEFAHHIIPLSDNKFGEITTVIPNEGDFANFLKKYNSEFSYENIFYHPSIWEKDNQVPDPNFYPILQNLDEEIVSFAYYLNPCCLYMFPNLKNNSDFIIEFLESIAPSLQPKLFPFSNQHKWVNNEEYYLPNHEKLLREKKLLKEQYLLASKKKDKEISINKDQFIFLHEILTASSDELVNAVIKYLEWLGFENVVDMDSETGGIKEEDIQIENEKGLLVIEVKGIGGTSKDSECSQISKIKYRRARVRGKFDVYGLYIVNHQKHIPAKERENPPFTPQQLQDALNDERGLLTTWQLFRLYHTINNEIITKEEARDLIYSYGLVSFKPKHLKLLGEIEEVFQNGKIFILKIGEDELCVEQNLYIEKNNEFKKIIIQDLQLDGKSVEKASKSEIGIKCDKSVKKKSKVWVKNLP